MSYYDILEVSPKASKEVIKNAYRALSKKYHPDTYKGDLKYAQEKMKEINTAYETLIDEEKRLNYDYENGFKIDPNAIVEEFKEAVENQEEYEEEEEQKKDFFTWLKEKKFIAMAGVCALFIIAMFIGNLIAGTGEKKEDKETTKDTSTTTTVNVTDTDKPNNNSYTTTPNNTQTQETKKEESKQEDKKDNDKNKEKEKVEEVTPQEPVGES